MLGCDLCGLFPTGENLLVSFDFFSRFLEEEILHKITSDCNERESQAGIHCRDTTKKMQTKILMDKSRCGKPHQIKVNTTVLATKVRIYYTSHRDLRPFVVTGTQDLSLG